MGEPVIGTVVISDRGDLYLPQCLAQLERIGLHADFIVDDSAHALGMAGAVNAAWDHAVAAGWDFLFHVEEDFLIYDAPLEDMMSILEHQDDLAQVTLKRQPVWGLEVELNDQLSAILHEPGSAYQRKPWGTIHKHLFSLNPSVVPRRIFEQGWPAGNEAGQSDRLRPDWWFGMLGTTWDPPRCFHIGEQRSAGWRL